MTKKRNEGFTLLEMLVVIVIIAILALIVLLAIDPAEMARKSRDSQRLSDLGTLRRAVDLALADGASLPAAGYSETTSTKPLTCTSPSGSANLVGIDICKYLARIPQDPQYKAAETATVQTSTGASCPNGVAQVARQDMVYRFKSDGSKYELNAYLEAKDNCETLTKDGGNQTNQFEEGTASNLGL